MESVAYEELLRKDGRVITHVVGSSMLPLLHDRQSIVIVENIQSAPPKKGDVVLYKTNGTYVLHRIQREKEDEYEICGDNTWTVEHIRKTDLLATMTGFYRTPDGTLITRTNTNYRIYRVLLPVIRRTRRIARRIRRMIALYLA